ncbi:hypothetical protein [Streptococcus sobrinus]|uniref:hypothetical protein n=1 Tax=Streptococcus sobrinus TaxID=1310 RepID=UPI000369F9E2|nr:hypothetical protein [Streptococcus sobrinus]
MITEWHKINEFEVYVEGGKVTRGTVGDGTAYRTVYPYIPADPKYGNGWVNVSGELSLSALKKRLARGTAIMK